MKSDTAAKITYVRGDVIATVTTVTTTTTTILPLVDVPDLNIVMHICNDANFWGRGFVVALSNKWPALKEIYHSNSKVLGSGLLVKIDNSLIVYNMVAQHGIKTVNSVPPIRYDALEQSLQYLLSYLKLCTEFKVKIHAPRIGCGLAGGKWSIVEDIIQRTLVDHGYQVYIYDL